MNIGWFDAFRENGAPTWYGENPTPVVLDLQIAGLLSLFVTPTIAFLLVLPGIRRFRALSAFTFLFSMTTGATILLSIHYPGWHSGSIRIFSTFRAHSNQRINGLIGVSIGLTHVNITLNSESLSPEEILLRRTFLDSKDQDRGQHGPNQAMAQFLFGTDNTGASTENNSDKLDGQQSANSRSSTTPIPASSSIREGEEPEPEPKLYYNERFDFDDVSGMEVSEWLEKGLPYPILQVVEYLSVDRTGFLWGKQYRLAGYYTFAALWLAFGLWLLQLLLLAFLPHRFGQLSLCCGLSILFADFVYLWHTPHELFLVFLGPDEHPHRLTFHPAICFYATLGTGLASTAMGAFLWFLEARTAFRLDTVFSACVDKMCRRPKSPGAASRRRFLFWRAPGTLRRHNASLSTPWGSFTSLSGGAGPTVGWKRRRRTLRREPCELDVYELQRRGGLKRVSSSARREPRRWLFPGGRSRSPPALAAHYDDDSDDLPSGGSVSPTPSELGLAVAGPNDASTEGLAHPITAGSSTASGYCSNASSSACTRSSALSATGGEASPSERPKTEAMLPKSDHPPMFTFEVEEEQKGEAEEAEDGRAEGRERKEPEEEGRK